jgi:hypothetical protein
MGRSSKIAGGLIALLSALYSAPSNAQSAIEVAGGEKLALGSWAMTLPDANVYACATAPDLARYCAIIAHNLASLHNDDPVLPKPSSCTTIDAGTEVQLVDAKGDSVCLHQRNQPTAICLWAKKIAVESKAAYAHDQQEQKSISDKVNQVFDRQHPECKEWRTKKNLPDYCY